jgi:hypothetical protein
VEREISKFISEIPSELLEFREYSYMVNQRSYFQPATAGTRKSIIEEISVNTRVVHPKFGRGIVLSVEKGVAEISFDNGMVMKFMLQYTPISIE